MIEPDHPVREWPSVAVRVYCDACLHTFVVECPAGEGRATVECENCRRWIMFTYHDYGAD